MLKLFFLATAAAGHKLALLPANEVSRTALLQDASIEPSADPDDGQITNFQSILRQLTNAVASINSPSTPISSATSMESEKSTKPEVFSLQGPSSATEAPHPLMGSVQPSPIPRRLLFNHKFNLLKASDASLDKQSKLLRDNVRHIVKLFPDIGPSDVHFWDDGDCQAGIEQLQLEESEALGLDFAREKVGMVKSDLCRLVMMYSLGGFYFDTDILPLPNLEQHLEPKATFATVIADDGKNYFQAFLAATPKHPAILESLKEFKKWYDQLNRPAWPKQGSVAKEDGQWKHRHCSPSQGVSHLVQGHQRRFSSGPHWRTCRTRLPILRGKKRPAPQGLPGPAVAPVGKTLQLCCGRQELKDSGDVLSDLRQSSSPALQRGGAVHAQPHPTP